MTGPLIEMFPVGNGAPKPPIWPGAVVAVAVPGKWVLHVHPEHPAYTDLLAFELLGWDTKALRELLAQADRFPGEMPVMREYVKAELGRPRSSTMSGRESLLIHLELGGGDHVTFSRESHDVGAPTYHLAVSVAGLRWSCVGLTAEQARGLARVLAAELLPDGGRPCPPSL